MTLNEQIRDLEIRHAVGLQRLSSAIVQKIIRILNEADADIVAQLRNRTATLEGSFTSQRLQYLLTAVREINRDAHILLGRELRQELRDLAKYEAAFQASLLSRTLPIAFDVVTPSAQLLNAVVTSRPFQGRFLNDMVRDLEASKAKALRNAVRLGIIEGQTSEQIIRSIVGTRAMNYRDGILNTSRLSAERMVRTATNHVANAAREKLYEENSDLIKGVAWVSTLDTRTCEECAALDGQVFEIDAGPRPPAHISCRCSSVPITKSWRELGIDADELEPGTRASMNGQVPATETYQSWLSKQAAAVQDEALGPSRGALFRNGGLTIDRFTNRRGDAWTLDELRAREAAAFEKAGMAA